jgi:hypothetical protein
VQYLDHYGRMGDALGPDLGSRSPGVCSVQAARLCPSPRLAGVSAAPSRGRNPALLGRVLDATVHYATWNQERLLRALDLEGLFLDSVRPLQRKTSFGRLSAI